VGPQFVPIAGARSLDETQCTERRLLTFKRTRDVTAADGVEDPSGIQARVVSPAQALHGRYHYTRSFPNGKPQDHDVAVRTDCLRTQERCMSFFNGDTAIIPLVFSNGKWLEDETFDGTCPSGGTSHVVIKAEFPLPQPPQDPISELTGHGHQDSSGSACVGTDFDGKFVRQGD
jgi:serine/threonine-protein kinase